MPVNTIAMPAASAATISYLAAIEIAVPLRGSVPPVFAVWPAAVARDVCTQPVLASLRVHEARQPEFILACRGTDGSNPPSSSRESATNRAVPAAAAGRR